MRSIYVVEAPDANLENQANKAIEGGAAIPCGF